MSEKTVRRHEWTDEEGTRRGVYWQGPVHKWRYAACTKDGTSTCNPNIYGVFEEILRLSEALEAEKAENERLSRYEDWADEAHIVFCHLLSLTNQGELIPTGRVSAVIGKIRDMMFTCPDDIGNKRKALEESKPTNG